MKTLYTKLNTFPREQSLFLSMTLFKLIPFSLEEKVADFSEQLYPTRFVGCQCLLKPLQVNNEQRKTLTAEMRISCYLSPVGMLAISSC